MPRPSTTPKPPPLLNAISYTLGDAARLSGLSIATLRRRAKEGQLRLFRSGGRALVNGDSLRALLTPAAE